MIREDVDVVRCPRCRSGLRFSGDERDGVLTNGELGCFGCGTAWQVKDRVARLFDERAVGPQDRFGRMLYDWGAPFHDAAVTYVLPFLQLSSEFSLRESYIKPMNLERLTRSNTGGRFRMLEVGVGAGANIPILKRRLPPNVRPEFWAVDLSEGMLNRCRQTHRTMRSEPIRYVLADAHVLPFADAAFDRVFHVGGIAGYQSPRAALAEMARVAKPGSPIVVVDEQLSNSAWAWQRLVFQLFAAVAPKHGSPEKDLPSGSRWEPARQISSFYYCLRFRMPKRNLDPVAAEAGEDDDEVGATAATPRAGGKRVGARGRKANGETRPRKTKSGRSKTGAKSKSSGANAARKARAQGRSRPSGGSKPVRRRKK